MGGGLQFAIIMMIVIKKYFLDSSLDNLPINLQLRICIFEIYIPRFKIVLTYFPTQDSIAAS